MRSKKYVFEIYSEVLVFNVAVINVLKVGGVFQKNNRRGAKGKELVARNQKQEASDRHNHSFSFIKSSGKLL